MLFQVSIDLLELVNFKVIADAKIAVTGVEDGDVIKSAAIFHPAIRRLDEAVVVDTRVTAQRRDEANVRTFRRLDGADAAVVRRVNVADFESGALARQSAWPQRGKTALVGDLRQRIGLIHELRELR